MLTDGDLADEDRLRRLVEGLGGTSTDRVIALPDGAEAHAPRFDRAPTWREPITLDAWRWADGASDIMVKQVLIGPYTLARLAEPGGAPREVLALASAEALNAELHALAAAGCPVIQIDEGALTAIGDDAAEWELYAETQRRLTAGLEDHHLSLGLYHGGIHPAGHAAVLGGPYRSFLVDAFGRPRRLALRVRGPAGDRRHRRRPRCRQHGARRDRGHGLGDGLGVPRGTNDRAGRGRRQRQPAGGRPASPPGARSS